MLALEITKEKMLNGLLEFDLTSDLRNYWGYIKFDIQVITEESHEDDWGVIYWIPNQIRVTLDVAQIESQTSDLTEFKLNNRNQQRITDFISKSFLNDPLTFGWGQDEPDYDDIDQ